MSALERPRARRRLKPKSTSVTARLGGALEGPPLAPVNSPGCQWGDWGTNHREDLFLKATQTLTPRMGTEDNSLGPYY